MMTDTTELAGKVAIVTGAGQGMGYAVAHRLAAAGVSIVVNDVNAAAAEQTAAALRAAGHAACAAPGDVASSEDVRGIVAATLDRYGGIHILINNAGVLRPTAVIDIEEAEWDLVVNVNLKGTYLCSRAVLPGDAGGRLGPDRELLLHGGEERQHRRRRPLHAAKAGVLGFTRHLAKEAAPYGITVNAVCPGLIDTEMVRATISDEQRAPTPPAFPSPALVLRRRSPSWSRSSPPTAPPTSPAPPSTSTAATS